MAETWDMEELDEYCQLFQTWRQAMLDAGYKLEDFKLTISKKKE